MDMLAGAFGMVASCLVVLSARTRAMMNLSIGAREYGYWLGAANLFRHLGPIFPLYT